MMPSNNTGKVVKELYAKYPNKLALLLNPNCIRPSQFSFPYAIDNAAFIKFEEEKYFKLLDTSKSYAPPMFITCPDVVGCHDRTLALWHYYYPILKKYNYKIAFVAQNGCTIDKIPAEANYIFIGGNDPWKMDNVEHFMLDGRPVHVGRVNGISRLKTCERLGVASIDGTGWMRSRDKKFYDLIDWFAGDERQLSLF